MSSYLITKTFLSRTVEVAEDLVSPAKANVYLRDPNYLEEKPLHKR